MIATYVYVELLMVSRTTAHRVNRGEKANMSTEELQSVKKGMIYYMRQSLKGNVQISCHQLF